MDKLITINYVFIIFVQHDYPSLYVTTSLTDRRVPPWGPIKYVAKLRRTNRCPDLLLQVDQDGGHFGSIGDEWTQVCKILYNM